MGGYKGIIMSNLSDNVKKEILDEIEYLSKKLNGEYLHQSIINSNGEIAKRIIITYDNEV